MVLSSEDRHCSSASADWSEPEEFVGLAEQLGRAIKTELYSGNQVEIADTPLSDWQQGETAV